MRKKSIYGVFIEELQTGISNEVIMAKFRQLQLSQIPVTECGEFIGLADLSFDDDKVEKDFSSPNEITNFLFRWKNDTDIVIINFDPIIKITSKGTVMIPINSPYLIQIAEEMARELSNNATQLKPSLISFGSNTKGKQSNITFGRR